LGLLERLLRQIIDDLLVDTRFKNFQFLYCEMLEWDGVCIIFGAANGGA
jgi:hypothetical protein